jgi:hypothetical protein
VAVRVFDVEILVPGLTLGTACVAAFPIDLGGHYWPRNRAFDSALSVYKEM